ncbi:pyridine nucleotide-disulfide oxidoreductase [Phlyctema vagabunda]|uniref:Pyridine nucleotide-disulfide oxidoreductase n=1 Tax=Phlyctema vagabunda TaxID=108571 RepID=A0ABR4PEY2_9HELO
MRVLISGAGIAGPTLAWYLTKAGSHITIVEKSQSLLAQGQNIDISGSAVKVIKKMGLLDQVRKFNTTEEGAQFIDGNGQSFAHFPVQPGSAASFTSELEILRGDLAAILYESTKDLPNVKYIFGTTIKEVISNNNDAVRVELSNGEIQDFDLLVAADGQWSKIRKQCFPSDYLKVVDKGAYVAYATIPRVPSDNNWWKIYLALQSRTISLRPDPYGTIRVMLSRMPCNDAQKKAWEAAARSDRQTQEKLLRAEFADAGWQAPRILDGIEQASDLYFQAIQQIRMTKWFTSRVVCLGDTAYAPTPFTGMGTSLAITGAYVLGGELSKLEEGEQPFEALNAYDNAFRPFVEEIQNLPFFVPTIAHPETAWKRWLIQMAVMLASKIMAIPWIMNKFGQSNEEDFVLPQYPKFD